MSEENILLIGAGGHAHSCLSLINEMGLSVSGFLDDDLGVQEIMGIMRVGGVADIAEIKPRGFIIGIGDHDHGKTRIRIHNKLQSQGSEILGLLSPNSNFAESGHGLKSNQVFSGAYFGPACIVGSNNIFNHKCIIEHQGKVGSHCHIGSAAILSGGVMIGDQVLIGANATLLPGVEINTGNIIGAGSVVTKSIHDPGGIYAGNPVRKIGDWDYEI